MKLKIIGLVLFLSLVMVACTPAAKPVTFDENGDAMVIQLAGTTSPYQEFSQAAYEEALAANKKIFLQWYATWCPSCRAEQKIAQPYFDNLEDEDVVGFRVNFKDKDTDTDEEAITREFGVSTQSTKIFIVNGERVHKTPEHYVTSKQYEDNFQIHFG